MNVQNIKVGDKVKIKYDTAGSPFVGKVGTVVSITHWKTYPVIVKFDDVPRNTRVSTRTSHGANTRHFSYNEIEKVVTETLVLDLKVIVNDNAVITILKDKKGKEQKKAVAKCHPDDTFDMHTGLQIAISRLFDKQIPLLNGTELEEVHYHKVVDGKGLHQSIELKTETNTYVMPVKNQ